MGRGEALEVQVQTKDGGLDPGVEVSFDGVFGLADLALEVKCSPFGGAAEAQRAGQVPGGGPAGPEGVNLVSLEGAEVAGYRAREPGFFGKGLADFAL